MANYILVVLQLLPDFMVDFDHIFVAVRASALDLLFYACHIFIIIIIIITIIIISIIILIIIIIIIIIIILIIIIIIIILIIIMSNKTTIIIKILLLNIVPDNQLQLLHLILSRMIPPSE